MRVLRSLATVAMTAALLTACGDKGDDGGDSGSGFTDHSAQKIADAATAAMGDLEAVSVDGDLTSDGQDIQIQLAIGSGGNCTGSFTTQGGTAEILGVDGDTWFKPDEAFWGLYGGADKAPALIAAAGDKWVSLPDDDTSFKPFCDIEEFLGQLTDHEDATYEKGDTTEVDGEKAIEILSTRPDEGTSSGYVRVSGEHYLVKIEKTEGQDPGTVSFSGFDEQPEVEAPADDDQIPLEQVEAAAQ